MLHTLKFQYVFESNIVIKGIAIVKSTANKGSCNSFWRQKKDIYRRIQILGGGQRTQPEVVRNGGCYLVVLCTN